MRSEYDSKALAFLKKWGINYNVSFVDTSCPPFCDGKHIHGNKYRVGMSRNGKRISFYFWNSFNDVQEGKHPTAYDVLACASGDLFCPETFQDFCAEYGYDHDSRKAEKTFKACRAQAERLARIFNGDEIAAELGTIT